MTISGRSLREHVRLLLPLFGVIAGVWLLRFITSEAGAPTGIVHALSVTVTTSVCILLAVLLIHKRQFGGYPSVVAAVFLLVCWEQLLIVSGIAMYVLTGRTNVFGGHEHSAHMHSPMAHIAGHLTFGLGFGELFGAAIGSLWLWVLRRIVPVEQAK